MDSASSVIFSWDVERNRFTTLIRSTGISTTDKDFSLVGVATNSLLQLIVL